MDPIIKYLLGEMNIIAQAPVTIAAAILILGGIMWWAIEWRYGAIIGHRNAELDRIRAERDDYREKLRDIEPKGALAAKPLEYATERESHIIALAPNKFAVMFSAPMRASPTLRFLEPDGFNMADIHLEYWSSLGFTVEFPPGIKFNELRFVADARRSKQ